MLPHQTSFFLLGKDVIMRQLTSTTPSPKAGEPSMMLILKLWIIVFLSLNSVLLKKASVYWKVVHGSSIGIPWFLEDGEIIATYSRKN